MFQIRSLRQFEFWMLWMSPTSKKTSENIRRTSGNIRRTSKRYLKKIQNIQKDPKKIQIKNYPKKIQKHATNIKKISKNIQKRSERDLEMIQKIIMGCFLGCLYPFFILFNTYVPLYIIIIYFVILCGLEIFPRGEIVHNNDI